MGTLRQILKIKPPEGVEKLPEGFKNKWIEALRGDRYQQSTGALLDIVQEGEDRVEVGFCCLGVAANVCEIGREHLLGKGTLYTSGDPTWNHMLKRLPKALVDNSEIQALLIQFNDGYSDNGKIAEVTFNFKQIAAWIEKYL